MFKKKHKPGLSQIFFSKSLQRQMASTENPERLTTDPVHCQYVREGMSIVQCPERQEASAVCAFGGQNNAWLSTCKKQKRSRINSRKQFRKSGEHTVPGLSGFPFLNRTRLGFLGQHFTSFAATSIETCPFIYLSSKITR